MLLTSRSNDQRQQIKAAYKKTYGKVRRATVNRELVTIGRSTEMVTGHISPHWTFSLLLFIYRVSEKVQKVKEKREANIFETLVLTFAEDKLSLELST